MSFTDGGSLTADVTPRDFSEADLFLNAGGWRAMLEV